MISHIDHLVLSVRSQDATCAFYQSAFGFSRIDAPGKPPALHFGTCKINVHQIDQPHAPIADKPTSGSADFCLITKDALESVATHLREQGVAIELGPVPRNGAQGPMMSIYVRDPDRNLVEISRYER